MTKNKPSYGRQERRIREKEKQFFCNKKTEDQLHLWKAIVDSSNEAIANTKSCIQQIGRFFSFNRPEGESFVHNHNNHEFFVTFQIFSRVLANYLHHNLKLRHGIDSIENK